MICPHCKKTISSSAIASEIGKHTSDKKKAACRASGRKQAKRCGYETIEKRNEAITKMRSEGISISNITKNINDRIPDKKDQISRALVNQIIYGKTKKKEKFGCFVEEELGDVYNDCVIESTKYNNYDCPHGSKYNTKEQCPYWRKIEK